MIKTKKDKRSDKFTYKDGDVKIISVKKPVKECYNSFFEFIYEKEEPFVASTMRWITIKDENDRNQHILIKKKDGTILGGMGGTRNGEKLSDVFKDLEDKREEKTVRKPVILDKNELQTYVSSFKKECCSAKDFHDNMSVSKINDLSEEANKAFVAYTGSAYKPMNKLLRDPSFYDEKLHPLRMKPENRKMYNRYIDECYNTLKNHKTTESVIAYRGVDFNLFEKFSNLNAGDVILDEGFVSTSTSRAIAKSFTEDEGYFMTVLIPKGSQAASVKNISEIPREDEIVINKKARFEVKGVDHVKRELIVELLPHED